MTARTTDRIGSAGSLPLTTDTGPERVEAFVADVELSEPLPTIGAVDPQGRIGRRAWLLIRLFSEPLGTVVVDLPIRPAGLALAIDLQIGPRVRKAAADARIRLTGPLGTAGIAARGPVPYLDGRAAAVWNAPHITVAICTRDHPGSLSVLLESVLSCSYPRFRILVVDNAPRDDRTERVVRAAAERGPVGYTREPRPGVAHARNRAMRETAGEIVACTDDDAVVDRFWLAEIARTLAAHPDAAVVTGPILPAELATPAQIWFEELGGLVKGRGLEEYVFSPSYRQDPLYPLPGFGAGANMAWRPGVLASIGGFDPALGPGSVAGGAEDTLAFMRVMRAGGTIVYHPGALVRHFHRRGVNELERQLVGYGVGLTAAYASLIRAEPSALIGLVRLIPKALRDVYDEHGVRSGGVGADFPRELLRASRRGLLRGPLAYAQGRRFA